MKQTLTITEIKLRDIIKSIIKEEWDDMRDWRKETIKKNAHNGIITLYHNTWNSNLNDIINEGELDTHQHHTEGHGDMLFFTINPEAWGKESKVSIDVPVSDFINGKFEFVNGDSVVTTSNISTNEYNFTILEVKHLSAERIFEILRGDDKRLQNYILNEFFDDAPAIKDWFIWIADNP